VRTLCDANYVNNPQVSTTDGSWLIQAYPGGAAEFSAYDGTQLECQGTAAAGTITISSAARTITLRILADKPAAVRRDNVALPEQGTPGSGIPGWRYDAATGFIEVDFTHSGGTTVISY
jgi:alpha-D-xyloside xylohydrolase